MRELRQREPRLEDKVYLKRVRQLPCCVPGCLSLRCEAAHIGMSNASLGVTEAGIGRKTHDAYVLPLCAMHHRQSPIAEHNLGTRPFWTKLKMDPHRLAEKLYRAHVWATDDLEALFTMKLIILEARFAGQD